MDNISYLTDMKGKKIALQINLRSRNKITLDEIEEIEDIISYELLKDEPSLDYNSEIEKIINKKRKNLV